MKLWMLKHGRIENEMTKQEFWKQEDFMGWEDVENQLAEQNAKPKEWFDVYGIEIAEKRDDGSYYFSDDVGGCQQEETMYFSKLEPASELFEKVKAENIPVRLCNDMVGLDEYGNIQFGIEIVCNEYPDVEREARQ